MADETKVFVPGDTPDAYFAVQYHVALKGLQVGTLLGMGVLAPAAYLLSGRRRGRTFFSYLRSEPLVGAGIMAPLSLGMGYFRLKDQPSEAIVDRAYRIKHNEGQQLVDKMCFYAAAAGGLAGAVGFGVNPFLGMAQGGGLGFGVGVLIYVAQQAFNKATSSKA